MKSKGMQVHTPTDEQLKAWRERAKKSLAIVRGGSVDEKVADQALGPRDRFRSQHSKN